MMTTDSSSAASAASLAICICTMDRPDALRTCLESIWHSDTVPQQVIVSDDSLEPEATRKLCDQFPFVQYIDGPNRGLCANRNQVIARATTSHVSLLDDDAVIAKEFVRLALDHARSDGERTIITGSVLDGGQVFRPGTPDFWGRFTESTRKSRYETIQLNCNLVPRAAFHIAQFDELIRYGFEDMDLCSALLAAGYCINYDPAMMNQHFPPSQSPEVALGRFRRWEQARYYTSLKRYFIWERSPAKGLFYLLTAPLYTAVFSAKWKEWKRIPQVPADITIAFKLFLHYVSTRRTRA